MAQKLDKEPRLQSASEPVISWARKVITAVNALTDWWGTWANVSAEAPGNTAGTVVNINGAGTSGYAALVLNKSAVAGSSNILDGRRAGVMRWRMEIGNGAGESGANAGSNFILNAYSDAGAWLGVPYFEIKRATGISTFTAIGDPGWVMGLECGGAQGAGIRLANSGGARTIRSTGTNLEFVNSAYTSVVATVGDTGEVNALNFTARAFYGLTVQGTNSMSVSYTYQDLLTGNPAWGTFYFRTWHQWSTWAGYMMSSSGNQIQFVLSNGGAYGSINAAAFNVTSDERAKKDVAHLERQASAFMAIRPIKWKWPDVPAAKAGDAPVYVDAREKWGFSAQNLSNAVAEAVHGDVRAVDAEGKPVTAGMDPVPILALTVLEVQALWAELTNLRAEFATLKGAGHGGRN